MAAAGFVKKPSISELQSVNNSMMSSAQNSGQESTILRDFEAELKQLEDQLATSRQSKLNCETQIGRFMLAFD